MSTRSELPAHVPALMVINHSQKLTGSMGKEGGAWENSWINRSHNCVYEMWNGRTRSSYSASNGMVIDNLASMLTPCVSYMLSRIRNQVPISYIPTNFCRSTRQVHNPEEALNSTKRSVKKSQGVDLLGRHCSIGTLVNTFHTGRYNENIRENVIHFP